MPAQRHDEIYERCVARWRADGGYSKGKADPLGDNHRAILPTYSLCKIAAEAVPYGIAKVVPPAGWKRPPQAFPPGSFKLADTIVQLTTGRGGLYTVLNMQKHGMTFERFERERFVEKIL